jgi:glycerol-3-phosphate acyltransferase PlsY
MFWITLAIIISYFLGSIPTAYIFGMVLKGIDIRDFGSGNVGATNALRVLGRGIGITVLFLDILKGFIAIVVIAAVIYSKIPFFPREILLILSGLSCISGHNWTVFLNFKGGKGVAATFGVLLGLAVAIPAVRAILGVTILAWALVFAFFRIISLASLASAVVLPTAAIIFNAGWPVVIFAFLLSFLVMLRHKANLQRLLEGKESRISFKKT